MAISGSLKTLPLTDLLQWIAATQQSGLLSVYRLRRSVQFLLDRGHIAGFTPDDTTDWLGHYVSASGKATDEQIGEVIDEARGTGESTARVLVRRGLVTADDLRRFAAAKAEETLFGLFEQEQAKFEFDPERRPTTRMIEVRLNIQDLVLQGVKRRDEMSRMREVFHDPGVVLELTGPPPADSAVRSALARRLYGLIDGRRSYAEILVDARGPEFLATKFLFELHRRGIVRVRAPVATGSGVGAR